MKTTHQYYIGDARRMTEVGDESVHLVVTSPPYWQLKNYDDERQIGYNQSYEEYVNHLNLVWEECARALKPGCRMIVNVGDQFARSAYYGRYKVIPIRTEIVKFCEEIGLDYLGAIIWQKKTTMNTTGGASVMGSYPYPRNGIVEIDYEFLLIFKKPGATPPPSKELKERSAMTKERWKEYFSGHWNIPGARQEGHLAMFPVEIPKRFIEMFTFVGETVLDPFMGGGTTSLAANALGRNSLGYEINEEFARIAERRFGESERSLFHEGRLLVSRAEDPTVDFERRIERFPYRFVDPHKLNARVDPESLEFGSKISKRSASKSDSPEYRRVVEILAPNELRLESDVVVRLLGVKPIEAKRRAAIEFIGKKITGGKIRLRFDRRESENENPASAYAYTTNGTFLNAHIIKNGYATVDEEIAFDKLAKFKDYARTGAR
jgi:modification methylase